VPEQAHHRVAFRPVCRLSPVCVTFQGGDRRQRGGHVVSDKNEFSKKAKYDKNPKQAMIDGLSVILMTQTLRAANGGGAPA